MQDKKNYEQKLRSLGCDGSLSWVAADRHALLNNILATHYRDGGHEVLRVGYHEATGSMINSIVKNRSIAEAARSQAERIASLMDEGIEPYEAINRMISLLKEFK